MNVRDWLAVCLICIGLGLVIGYVLGFSGKTR